MEVAGRRAARETALAAALDAVLTRTDGAPVGPHDPDWDAGLLGLVDALGVRPRPSPAPQPPGPGSDAVADRLHRAVGVWVAAWDPSPDSDRLLVDVLADLPDVSDPVGRVTAHVLVEGLVAHGRLDLAAAAVDAVGPGLWGPVVLAGREHPWGVLVGLCRVRLLAFRGCVAEADACLAALPQPQDGPLAALVAGTTCLVRGNQLDAGDVRRLVAVVDQHAPVALDHLGAGAQMLAAFGLIAIGAVEEAARRVLLAGGDEALTRLTVVDRVHGLEMLAVLALGADDLDAAAAWADQAQPLVASPSADSAAARLLSRLALAEGRDDDAVAWGERAVARAQEVDRVIEHAEGEIVLGRARIHRRGAEGPGAAVRALEAMVTAAEQRGHAAARRAASRELRPIGVRLRPLAGSGWAGLSAREAEVARMVVEGRSNREVAAGLHLSEHTVRAHVSRVLAAFGVATRAALPAVAGGPDDRPPRRHSALTPRQDEVARLVAEGLSNRAIGERLGLSVRTVEKHVGDIALRWDLVGRTAIARAVSGRPAASPSGAPDRPPGRQG